MTTNDRPAGRGRAGRDARGRARLGRRERLVRELRAAHAVARTALRPGTVAWAWVAFADAPGMHKARPVVVREVAGHRVRVHRVTSSTKESVRQSSLYVALDDWGAAGLTRPCVVDRRV